MTPSLVKPPEPDAAFEISLRPPAFSEFTGQIKVRERLELMVEAANKRGDVLEHILLSGPSGLGKTTLAFIIANAMNVNIKNTSGPVIEKAGELAARSRGTPRTANNLLRWVRDYVQVKAEGKISAELADRALTMLEIDRDGFDQWDKRIIETLIHKFNGGPVGLNSLAVAIGEEAGTIEAVNEPYLIMEGYIKRTPQGRVATANAYRKLGLKPPASAQAELL